MSKKDSLEPLYQNALIIFNDWKEKSETSKASIGG